MTTMRARTPAAQRKSQDAIAAIVPVPEALVWHGG